MITMIFQFICIFLATVAFSVFFYTPKSELIIIGIVGLISWIILVILLKCTNSQTVSNLASAFVVTLICRKLSYVRKNPVSLYIFPSIIPLAPGYGIYKTMYAAITDSSHLAFISGIETLKIAGAIALGITIGLSLPATLFKR